MPSTFYQSKEWKRLRAKHLKRFPLCMVEGCTAPATFVDHIETVKAAPHKRLDPANLNSLCAFHHGALTAAYDAHRLAGLCDEDGLPLDPMHPWKQESIAAAIDAVNAPSLPSGRMSSTMKQRHIVKR
jgi:hypothetical protein